jgi:hypothetical protein
MEAPPLEAGAEKATVAWALPPVTLERVGAPGTVTGVVVELDELPPLHPANTARARRPRNPMQRPVMFKPARANGLGRSKKATCREETMRQPVVDVDS